jgi:putative IMPACT (imprinted ancient) family translation regulator
MKELSAIKYEVRKSRFYAHLYLIESEEDVAAINGIQRELYKKADHHCYAARYPYGNSCSTAFGNDGEVGRPGRSFSIFLFKRISTAIAWPYREYSGA